MLEANWAHVLCTNLPINKHAKYAVQQRERARLQDLAEHHVLAIEMGRGHGGDEEPACSVVHTSALYCLASCQQRSHCGCMGRRRVCAQQKRCSLCWSLSTQGQAAGQGDSRGTC